MNSEVLNLSLSVGELVVSCKPAVVSTVLGSCISVCLFSSTGKGGGIIHYALPCVTGSLASTEALRYGEYALQQLVCELMKATGEPASAFRAKLVGGSFETTTNGAPQVGAENIALARTMLKELNIPIVGESVGGPVGRKILFHIPSGRLQVAKLTPEKVAEPPTKKRRYRVLIVDDSKTIRELLKRVLSEDPDLEVVGFASEAMEAQKLLDSLRPDVITLDIHMPKMTGVEWLERLLPQRPIPVVMISSLQLQEGNEVFKALELGAVDYIQKPSLHELAEVAPLIREKVKSAAQARVIRHRRPVPSVISRSGVLDFNRVLAVGASTGGTEALKSVFLAMPAKIPPTVVVQHIPAVFSKAFADRLNQLCPFEVKEAEDGDELKASRVLIAPGGLQMKIEESRAGLRVRVIDDPPVSRHKPSVDYLFQSVAQVVGKKSIGVILTGMGADGAKGLLQMRQRGARTLGQDEETCVVYGMPRVAFEMGAVEKVCPLQNMVPEILKLLEVKKAA